jgi:hypothetical protein
VDAVLGAILVAPSGAGLLWRSANQSLRKGQGRVRGLLARFLPFLRRHMQVHVTDAAAGADLVGVATLTATGAVWPGDAPMPEQIEALRRRVAEMEEQLQRLAQQLREEVSLREQAVVELQSALQQGRTRLEGLLEVRERQSARIDARGLPVIAAGIVLSSGPDELASIPYGIGLVFTILGIGVLAASLAVFCRRSPEPG